MRSIEVIGHRGNKAAYTENTLHGFESAFTSIEFDGVELDVVVSQDKQLFVAHDMHAKFNQENRWHHQFSYQQVLDTAIEDNDNSVGKYPLLEQVFALYQACNSDQKIQIEIKSDPSLNLPLNMSELISAVQILIHRYGLLSIASITSFDYRYTTESKRQDPSIKTGLIMHRCLLPLDSLISMEPDAIIFEKNWIIKDDIQTLDTLGIDSYAWTANSKSDWARLKDIKVTGIITDRPKDLANWLKE